jgi:hypothetical protein
MKIDASKQNSLSYQKNEPFNPEKAGVNLP